MELNIKEPKNIKDLKKILKDLSMNIDDVTVKVENNIFSVNGKWLLRKKEQEGYNKLDNFNGTVENMDRYTSFRGQARKCSQIIDKNKDVKVKKLLYSKLDLPQNPEEKPCLTLSYLSVLDTANFDDIKKWEDSGCVWQDINNVNRSTLMPNVDYAYGVLRQNIKGIDFLLKDYKGFDEKYFEKYFFHGIDNKKDLLTGMMYYTNSELTDRYLNLSEEDEIFPTSEEMLNILEKKLTENCEQLYRFVYLNDREDNRFDYKLSEEEMEKVREIVKETINKNRKDLLVFKRGIFFNDRIDGNYGKTYDQLKNLTWVKEVYKVVKQLQYMEITKPKQYYKKWFDVKIERLKNNERYSKEKLEVLQKMCDKFIKENIEHNKEK